MDQLPVQQRRHAVAIEQEVAGTGVAVDDDLALGFGRDVCRQPPQRKYDQGVSSVSDRRADRRETPLDGVMHRGHGTQFDDATSVEAVQDRELRHEIGGDRDALRGIGDAVEHGVAADLLGNQRAQFRGGGDEARDADAAIGQRAGQGAKDRRLAQERRVVAGAGAMNVVIHIGVDHAAVGAAERQLGAFPRRTAAAARRHADDPSSGRRLDRGEQPLG